MNNKTKIVVLHRKEIVYTLIFLLLAILLGLLLFLMFGKPKTASTSAAIYTPGVYCSTITLNDNTFDVEVTVDSNRIKSISLVNLSETTAAMFPLMEPAMDELTSQIYQTQSLDEVTYSEDTKYTSLLLLSAISKSINMAEL